MKNQDANLTTHRNAESTPLLATKEEKRPVQAGRKMGTSWKRKPNVSITGIDRAGSSDKSGAPDQLEAALGDAVEYARGGKSRGIEYEVRQQIDIAALRTRLGMTQAKFAFAYRLSRTTVQNWEQGHRSPDGPARVLLKLIDRHPHKIAEMLSMSDD